MFRRTGNSKSRGMLISFTVGTLLGVMTACGDDDFNSELPAVKNAENKKSFTPEQNKLTKENRGKRCEAKLYDYGNLPEETTPEYKLCLDLQKRLNRAAWDGRLDEIRETLEMGANVNAGYYQEGGPLGLAIMKGQAEAVGLLIANGAEVNVKYKWDETPLHRAAYYDFVDIARILIENGANVCEKMIDDVAGSGSDKLVLVTPLEVANEMGHREIAKLLQNAGTGRCQ